MTALVAAIATTSLALAAGCGVSTESEGPTDDGAEIGESASALQIGTGFTTKTQSELEADGWTCKLLSGTTITFCTKPGTSGSWSCNDRGTCTQNKTAPPKPPIYGTTSGIVIGGTLSP